MTEGQFPLREKCQQGDAGTCSDLPTVASGCGPVDPIKVAGEVRISNTWTPPRYILQFQAHEEDEHRDALNGSRWRQAVDEYAQELRRILKYGDPCDNNPGLEAARELLFKILEEEGLRLYD